MNEENLRQQSNVIYGAPCEVYAASQDKNLIQAAQLPARKKTMEEAVADLDKILSFTELPGDRQKAQAKKRAENDNKKVVQAGLSDCKNTERLIRILNFGVDEK